MLNSSVINLSSNHFKGQMPQLSANVKKLNIANNSIFGPISTILCKKMNRKNRLFIFGGITKSFIRRTSSLLEEFAIYKNLLKMKFLFP